VITPFLRELIRTDPRISYEWMYKPCLLGEKYNYGISKAPENSLIALWADDDWHHKQRLSLVLAAMIQDGADVGGTISMLSYRYTDKQVYLYAHPYTVTPDLTAPEDGHDDSKEMVTHGFATVPYMLSATMIFPKSRWAKAPFPHLQHGSDTGFIESLMLGVDDESAEKITVCQINEPRLYCAFIHGNNTGCPVFGAGTAHSNVEESKTFIKFDAELNASVDLRRLFGDDAAAFLDVTPPAF
jgi:hypothetical protein